MRRLLVPDAGLHQRLIHVARRLARQDAPIDERASQLHALAKLLAKRLRTSARSLRQARRNGLEATARVLSDQCRRLRDGLRYVRDYESYVWRRAGTRLGFAYEPTRFATPTWDLAATTAPAVPAKRRAERRLSSFSSVDRFPLDPQTRPQED